MKRSLGILLCGVAVLTLLPSLALAVTDEQTQTITYFDINDPNVSSGSNGLLELQDTGLVITDMADCSYYHRNADGTYATVSKGWNALVNAVLDGSSTTATQGITPLNARNASDPNASLYAIGYAANNGTSTGLAVTTFGTVTNVPVNSNTALVRETWVGDGSLSGVVNATGYNLWADEYDAVLANPGTAPEVTWATGDFSHTGVVNATDYNLWADAYDANVPALTPTSAGPVRLTGGPMLAAVPEPSAVALCLAGAFALMGFGLGRSRKAAGMNNNSSKFQASKGSGFMKKCLLVLAAIAALAAGSTARADLLDYSLVPDGVYSNSTFTTSIANSTISGSSVTLPQGTTAAYVRMAVVATINNGSSEPISGDGIAEATLNFLGTSTSMGTDSFNSILNTGNNMGNKSGNPGGGTTAQKWKSNHSSPVQGYTTFTSNTSGGNVTSYTPNAATQWLTNFTKLGSQAGVNTGSSGKLVIGSTSPVTSTTFSNEFVAIFSAPSVPSNASVVNYNSTGATTSLGQPNDGSAVQPFPSGEPFLLGASGVNATTATFVLGELDYHFTGAANGGTASLQAVPADVSQLKGGQSADFLINGVATQAGYGSTVTGYEQTTTAGSAGNVGAGTAVSISILGGVSLSSGSITLASLTATPGTAAAAGSFTVTGSGTGGLVAYSGATSTIGASLTNASGQVDAVNYSVTATGNLGGLVTSPGTGNLAAGGQKNLSFTYTPNQNTFGIDTITLTPSGTNATLGGAATANAAQTINVDVIGVANRGSGASSFDGAGTPGVETGNLLSTGLLAQGTNLAGFETSLSNQASSGIGATTAAILAGTLSSGTTVTMQWRARAPGELPAASKVYNGLMPLYSDVVDLTGTAGTAGSVGSTFVLQMSYDPSQLGGTVAAQTAASNGFIYLGYRDPSTGVWHNATAVNGTAPYGQTVHGGNDSVGADAVANYQGSFATFTSTGPGAGDTLQQLLGSWGVDPSNDVAWAVVDHGGEEFAVVPEPGTLVLLGAGLAALACAYRRRKAAKA